LCIAETRYGDGIEQPCKTYIICDFNNLDALEDDREYGAKHLREPEQQARPGPAALLLCDHDGLHFEPFDSRSGLSYISTVLEI